MASAARSPGAKGFSEGMVAVLLGSPDQHRAIWLAHRDALLAEFAVSDPGKRPWGWWEYESREPRLNAPDVDDALPSDDELNDEEDSQ